MADDGACAGGLRGGGSGRSWHRSGGTRRLVRRPDAGRRFGCVGCGRGAPPVVSPGGGDERIATVVGRRDRGRRRCARGSRQGVPQSTDASRCPAHRRLSRHGDSPGNALPSRRRPAVMQCLRDVSHRLRVGQCSCLMDPRPGGGLLADRSVVADGYPLGFVAASSGSIIGSHAATQMAADRADGPARNPRLPAGGKPPDPRPGRFHAYVGRPARLFAHGPQRHRRR